MVKTNRPKVIVWFESTDPDNINILVQRWFPIGDIGVGVLLSSHIGLILDFHRQYFFS